MILKKLIRANLVQNPNVDVLKLRVGRVGNYSQSSHARSIAWSTDSHNERAEYNLPRDYRHCYAHSDAYAHPKTVASHHVYRCMVCRSAAARKESFQLAAGLDEGWAYLIGLGIIVSLESHRPVPRCA